MANSLIDTRQIEDGGITRDDLNVDGIINGAAAVTGLSVLRKVIGGTGISISSTGFDAGTGDATINLNIASAGALGGIKVGSGLSIDGTGILSASGAGTSVVAYSETPSGTINGSNTTFTLANIPASPSGVIVFLDGVVQYNGIDYTVSGSTITFTTAPASGSSIFAYYNNLSTGTGQVAYVSFTEQSFTATASQTTFTISGGYTPGLINVFYNGARLSPSEYTATNGTTVVLATGATLNAIIDVQIFSTTPTSFGTVSSVSVVSANGFAGSVATATSTPAITLSTTITGILKGNGTAISAATAGTDYQVPITAGDVTTSGATSTIASGAVTYAKIQNVTTQTLLGRYAGTTGIAQEITLGSGLTLNSTTGVLTASGGTALNGTGYVKMSGTTPSYIATIPNADLTNSAITIAGTSTALGGTITQDTITGLSSTGLIKRTGANTLAIATAGTDYLTGNQTITLSGDVSGSGATAISTTVNWVSSSNTGGWTVLKVSGSDATTTGQSLIDITGLVTSTLSNGTLYEIEVVLYVSTSNVSTGTQYGINAAGTGGASEVFAVVNGTTTTNAASTVTIAASNTATAAFLTTSSASGIITMKGFVKTRGSGTATISIQHLKVTSGTSTVKIGSVLRYRLA